MTPRPVGRGGLPSVVIGALVVVLVVVVAVLVALAIDRGRGMPPTAGRSPVPSFSSGESDTPTPTAAPAPAIEAPGSGERFLAAGDGVVWRATAGECRSAAPVVERSDDAGDTWEDVTPSYRDIAQVRDLTSFAETEADLVADVGDECETQALRTFTQGTFWSPYDDLLAGSTYLIDRTVVDDGEQFDAPCDEPWGLRAARDITVVICDGTAHQYRDGTWEDLASGVAAVSVSDGEIFAAIVDEGCDGLQVARLDDDAEPLECLSEAEPTAPTALDVTADAVWVWNGDEIASIER
ncbi:hypothetical protein AB3M83_12770 [Microbacterium sp. 179-B 1A2 NHS]|uniref:hypothetical protein n=1 Tax=Microbacterium sp. 179-B 1A2 NHS TaxID=3142383 RepID=UPI00399F18F3